MVPQNAIEQLKRCLRGQLLVPGDSSYDEGRKIWNGMIDKRPALIARCSGTGDVVHTVKFAREHDLPIAIRGGGHNIAGKCISEGGLTIDLSGMKGVRVDLTRGTARAEAGVKLGEFDRETQAFGLATTLGIASDTGIAGITLGGGYGWLAGKYGLACDNLLSADVVTADGELLVASETENADLFWGVRGGGGNFGVVTSFEYRVHPVSQVFGGAVFYPLSMGPEALPVFHEFASTAPDEISTFIAPAAALNGTPAVGIAVCYCGPAGKGESLLAPIRNLGTPLADLIQERSYLEMQSLFDDMFTPGRLYYWKSSLLRKVDASFIEAVFDHAPSVPLTPGSFIYMQQLHGAASRVARTDTAFPHRYDHYNCGAMAGWDSPAETDKNILWARQCWESMQPFFERCAYVNDLGDEGEQRVKDAFGENYDRLLALKKKYDPANFFRMNQNVRPEAEHALGAA
jgi:FAD binding domain-containing protein/berberine-like enzyme